MDIENLFSEPVGVFKSFRPLNDSESLYIHKELQDIGPNVGNKVSSNTFVLKSEELSELHSFCLDALNEFTTTVYGQPLNLRITQSWLNLTESGQFHHLHSHPNSVISGVYYVQTSKSDRIEFARPEGTGLYDIVIPNDSWNIWNSKTWWMPTPQGSLVLFKSTLKHHVPPVISADSRISLSFNTFFSKDFGSEQTLSLVEMPYGNK
jgi:uncharacterized protein (TIGR02466 family)